MYSTCVNVWQGAQPPTYVWQGAQPPTYVWQGAQPPPPPHILIASARML